MATVTVRDAGPSDAEQLAEVWASATPFLVRSAARAASDVGHDAALGRRRVVAVLDDQVVGTATAREVAEDKVFLTVEVHADYISRGVGTALLTEVAAGFPHTTELTAVCRNDPIALAFAVRNGFLPEGEDQVARVDLATLRPAGPVPPGLRAATLDTLPNLDGVLATYNEAAEDDPSGLSHPLTPETLRAQLWDNPDNAPGLSWALLEENAAGSGVASFTSLLVDRSRGRAWSAMTATRRDHRGRGLATWVKRRTLNAAAASGITEAWTVNDVTNAAMIAVNDALGYVPHGRTIRVSRRLPH